MSDFLVDMVNTNKFMPDTLEGVKSCICSTIKVATGVDLVRNVELSAIMAKFHLDCPREKFEVPDWNLCLVLNSLMEYPYEPIRKASLKHLTYKTVFLVGMACAGRIADLHALDFRKVWHDNEWRHVWLEPNSLSMAKTQKDNKPSSQKQFKLTNLREFVGPREKDAWLCPVRALRVYMDRTKDMRKGKKCLFVSLQPNRQGDITRQSINIWIRNTIRLAYALAGRNTENLGRATNHEIRSVASSLAYERSMSLNTLMRACHWKHANTFTSYYLKDVAVLSQELMRLSPIVVASTVINKVYFSFTLFESGW